MTFNSWQYALFLPLTVVGHFLLPQRLRWAWLLFASCFFYMFFVPQYLLILAATIVVDYTAGLLIARSTGRRRQLYLWSSVLVTCAILFVFKYLHFAQSIVYDLESLMGVAHSSLSDLHLDLLLPIGLSFHTFQSLSYVIEVYRGRQAPERHFGIYALYVMFFPQLVAGPIERPQNLLHQFREKKFFDPQTAASGLRLLAWGLFQKTVVADRLGIVVDAVYDSYGAKSAAVWLIATLFFAFQIYADFQGYSNIARGSARLLGFDLMKNFDRPYAATSVTEFWRRWHISLSTWFRDYVFIPLGGSRRSRLRTTLNLLLTFSLSGLWHGANWTYLVWGACNAVFVSSEHFLGRPSHWLNKWLARLLTFLLITVSWTFFRAKTLGLAWAVICSFPEGLHQWFQAPWTNPEFFHSLNTSAGELILALVLILALNLSEIFEGGDFGEAPRRWRAVVRWPIYIALVGVIVVSWIAFPVDNKPFIYFQF
jgi:alginate O-acetyltransferase complex protein AlgI